MLPFIHALAHGTNAVLLAILPQVSDFAKKAELPIVTPITAEHIRQFRPLIIGDEIGGVLIFTNDVRIRYLRGHVESFQTPRSYFNLQNPSDIPKFYGELKWDTNEALRFARSRLRTLGYSLKETFADQLPQIIDMPQRMGTNVVPFYQFHWQDPVFHVTAVSMEVDAQAKKIQSLALITPFLWRSMPKLSATNSNNKAPLISATVSNACVADALPTISSFAQKLNLPLNLPLTPKQVQKVAFVMSNEYVAIKIKNSFWFVIQNGTVTEFNALDSVYGRRDVRLEPFVRPLKEYLGKWKISEEEAVELARKNILNLGYNAEAWGVAAAPQVIKHEQIGKYVVPRYFITWLTNSPATGNADVYVRAEIDADKKQLKYLEFLRRSTETSFPRPHDANHKLETQIQSQAKPRESHPTISPMLRLKNVPEYNYEPAAEKNLLIPSRPAIRPSRHSIPLNNVNQ